MSFEPVYSDDRRPRYGRSKATGTVMFWHPCKTCGRTDAGYGYNCTKTNLGDWYCKEHRPDQVTASTKAPPSVNRL
jgi:hypothetical protein